MSIRRITRPLREPYCWNCGDSNGRQLVTVAEAAKYCNVSINTLYRWMERGLIDWVYNAGGKRRIYKDSLVRHPNNDLPAVSSNKSVPPPTLPDPAAIPSEEQ